MFRYPESRDRGLFLCDVDVPGSSSDSDVITFLSGHSVCDINIHVVRLDILDSTRFLIRRYSRSRVNPVHLLTDANLVTRWNVLTRVKDI